MRDMRQGVCALCNHNEIIVSWPLDFSHMQQLPMAVSHEVGKWVGTKPNKPLGALYLCCCRKCGFTQWFAAKPEEIEIGDEYRTQLITGPEQGGPYR